MNTELEHELDRLCRDFAEVNGDAFSHFYCPILFEDESVPLCKGHVVNQAFRGVSKRWTVQRRDVDSFFGSHFEAEFTSLQELADWKDSGVFSDKKKHRKVRPRIVVDGREVEHFVPTEAVPNAFTAIEIYDGKKPMVLGLKMNPEEMKESAERDWAVEVARDIRFPAFVSVVKAAHLTLFALLGYRYALSAAGHFVGWDVLGRFLRASNGHARDAVLKSATEHFREFSGMVRPVLKASDEIDGTIDTGQLLTCWSGSGYPWAMILYVRTGSALHAAMVPVFDHPDGVKTFVDFQKSSNESITARSTRFTEERWEIAKQTTRIEWPKTGVFFD